MSVPYSSLLGRTPGVQDSEQQSANIRQSYGPVQPQQPQEEQAQEQEQQQQQQQPAQSWRRFIQEHYSRADHLDAVFYAIHLLMSAIHKRVLVTAREQAGFQIAMSAFAGALLLRLFFKPVYARQRGVLVFWMQVLLTMVRAGVVYTMAAKQAVHFRAGMLAEYNHTAGILMLTMLSILGGPFRLFEMLGLQQPWVLHVLVSLLYLVIHPWAALDGIRLAYSNAMFHQVHAVHDAVSALFDGLLELMTGMPTGQQQTCSSCAGPAVYGFMCLFGSVAAPLYVVYVREQAAYRQWLQQSTATVTAAPAAAATAATAAGDAALTSRDQGTHAPLAEPEATAAASSNPPAVSNRAGSRSKSNRMVQRQQTIGHDAGSSTSVASSRHRVTSHVQLIEQQAEALAAGGASNVQFPTLSLAAVLACNNMLVRWCVHVLILALLLVVSWLVSNAVALVLLPRVLNRQQLDLWCPNRPYAPYVIAGQVYEGI